MDPELLKKYTKGIKKERPKKKGKGKIKKPAPVKKQVSTDSDSIDLKEWEVRPCSQGKGCWCRMIYVKGTSDIIIPGAVIGDDMANYITKIHNNTVNGNECTY